MTKLNQLSAAEAARRIEAGEATAEALAAALLGVPCISVPHGKGAHGLPLGVQLVGPFDGDTALLGWAHWAARALKEQTAPE